MTIAWEYIDGKPGTYDWTRRARVPGGWIVESCVKSSNSVSDLCGGTLTVDIRQALTSTFIPDPKHAWGLDPEAESRDAAGKQST